MPGNRWRWQAGPTRWKPDRRSKGLDLHNHRHARQNAGNRRLC